MIAFAKSLLLAAMLSLAAWFPVTSLAAGQQLTLGKGTQVQKLAPGHFRFRLPDGRIMDARDMNVRTGIIGDCGIYDAVGHKLGGGLQCRLQGGMKSLGDPDPPPAAGGRLPPSPNYVQIDDEITWLPATLSFTALVQAPAMAHPGVADPLQRKMINPQPEPPAPATVK